MLVFLRFLTALAIGVWLGAMLFFSAGVAPAAFAAMPSRELAGTIVNAVMRNLHTLAYVAGGVLLLGHLARRALGDRRFGVARVALAAGMLAIALYSGLAVSPPLAEIRARVGSIDALDPTNPERDRFNQLHKLSVSLMGVNLVLGVALLALDQARGSAEA
jgi:uncharacterized membrane protein